MGQKILHKAETIHTIAEYAGLIVMLSQQLLDSGRGSFEIFGASAKAKQGKKFDVASLRYERAKNNLLDAIASVRLADFQDIPFFLSHLALLNVKARMSREKRLSRRSKDLLSSANHQVFIFNVEDLIDRATNHNFDIAQSKRGYRGDRIDVILKLKSVIEEYLSSQKSLGGDLPPFPNMIAAMQMTRTAREARERGDMKEALRLAGLSAQSTYAIFDAKYLQIKLQGMAAVDDPIYLILHDGQIMWHQDRMRLNIRPQKFTWPHTRAPQEVILKKYYIREILEIATRAQGDLRVRIENGAWYLDLLPSQNNVAESIPDIIAMHASDRMPSARAAMGI